MARGRRGVGDTGTVAGMEHVRFGRTGLRVSRLVPGHDDVRLPVRRARLGGHPGRGGGGRYHLPRHCGRVPAGRAAGRPRSHRGDARPVAARAVATGSCSRPSASARQRTITVGRRQLPPEHHACHRRVAPTPADRLRRPLPAALLRRAHARSTSRSSPSTTSSTRARSATSASRTRSPTSWPDPSVAASSSGVARFDSLQPRYNLLFRQPERELLRLAAEEQVAVIPYNALAGGLLTGKHAADRPPTEGTRFTLGNAAQTYTDRYWHEREFATVEALRPLADEAGVPMADMAVQWVLANPVITAPIIGASRPDQLDAAVAAVESPLEPDLKARLDELDDRVPRRRRCW